MSEGDFTLGAEQLTMAAINMMQPANPLINCAIDGIPNDSD